MSARVWLPAPGVVLVHRSAGFPMPAGHVDAVEATHYACAWLWSRRDVWPCFHERQCDELATVRVQRHGWRPVRYYCERHAPIRPTAGPVGLCRMCGGPLDPAVTDTHPVCVPGDGTVTEAEALVTLLAAFPDCEETTQ
jgi:hypothetical protein